jgi:hypothetical protein
LDEDEEWSGVELLRGHEDAADLLLQWYFFNRFAAAVVLVELVVDLERAGRRSTFIVTPPGNPQFQFFGSLIVASFSRLLRDRCTAVVVQSFSVAS